MGEVVPIGKGKGYLPFFEINSPFFPLFNPRCIDTSAELVMTVDGPEYIDSQKAEGMFTACERLISCSVSDWNC